MKILRIFLFEVSRATFTYITQSQKLLPRIELKLKTFSGLEFSLEAKGKLTSRCGFISNVSLWTLLE